MAPQPVTTEGHLVRPLPSTEPSAGAAPWWEPPVPATGSRRPAPPPGRGDGTGGGGMREGGGMRDGEGGVPVPAQRAAHAVVRMALEVVDRKRPAHQTRGAFPPHLTEMLVSLARDGVPGRDLGPARVHRLHISATGPVACADADADYEVCATYARGPRLFAVAARVRVSATGAVCTALRLV